MKGLKLYIPVLAIVMLAQAAFWAPADSLASEGAYTLDGVHSHVGFAVRHLGVSKIRGRFNKMEGLVVYNEKDISQSSVEVTIQAASIDTQSEKRDADVAGEGFLNAEKYPEITFKSTKVKKKGDGLELTGDLTIHGVTKQVTFPVTLAGPTEDPWGMTRLGVEGRLKIDRQEFGIKFDKAMDNGGLIVGNTVEIELSIEAVKK